MEWHITLASYHRIFGDAARPRPILFAIADRALA